MYFISVCSFMYINVAMTVMYNYATQMSVINSYSACNQIIYLHHGLKLATGMNDD